MASKVLTTQSLLSISTPRFTATTNNCTPFFTNFASLSLNRKITASGFKNGPLVCKKRFFVVRADADVEGDVAVAEEGVEVVEEVEEVKRMPIVKLGDIMGILNKKAIDASDSERPIPDIRTGDIVQIKLEVENRRRPAIFKGIVIARSNAGIHTTIRIRRIMSGCGVEIVFPLYSPNIKEIKVVATRKVRRAKLYYLRDKLPRFSTFKK